MLKKSKVQGRSDCSDPPGRRSQADRVCRKYGISHYTFFKFVAGRLAPPYWIKTGAMAISTNGRSVCLVAVRWAGTTRTTFGFHSHALLVCITSIALIRILRQF